MPVRTLIRVEGIVQGVGFRPFVHRTATGLGLVGHVANDERGVLIEAQGEPARVADLVAAVREHPPPLAVIERLTTTDVPCGSIDQASGFEIRSSSRAGAPVTWISPDVATCDDCLRELFDPADRRYRYPFVNCTNCGPRFTIVTAVPYDRPATTMAGFEMCADCRREYVDPGDRRFHAQPVCCPACGPRLRLIGAKGVELTRNDPLVEAARLLAEGAVLAVKGLGGYHLAAVADEEKATEALRRRKHREDKPFAVLCPDLQAASRLVDATGAETLLTSPSHPIVILPRRQDAQIAAAVAPETRTLGVFLPYTPLHHLLVREVGRPLVLTSGNVSDEPIAFHDEDALSRLADIADGFLLHDRPIHTRVDDSVLRYEHGRTFPVRRSRGYSPAPMSLPVSARRPVLGCGAELKNTFTLVRNSYAVMSHHIGDLENAETLQSFTDGIDHLQRLLCVEPEIIAHDLHPEYLSTKWALEIDDIDLVAVQHHHAHIASCLADNGVTGPVIGVAYDGLGYGSDGTLWGGELLLADLTGFTRLGHLEQAPLPGGGQAIRQPWRMAAAWLLTAYDGQPPRDLAVQHRHEANWDAVMSLAGSDLPVRTSSVGRLFDAVAALCGVRDTVNYEGQAAIGLEQRADPSAAGSYLLPFRAGKLLGTEIIRQVVADLEAGIAAPVIATRLHRGLADGTANACRELRDMTGCGTVALSGGVFQNALLLELLEDRLQDDGFRVLTHRRIPPNDGGISLGQVAVAAALDLTCS
jgi:hydrogenase maturation protein HypF